MIIIISHNIIITYNWWNHCSLLFRISMKLPISPRFLNDRGDFIVKSMAVVSAVVLRLYINTSICQKPSLETETGEM